LVLDDGLVSRRHAQLVIKEERVTVEDFSSANGVFVNGKRVAGNEPLKPGDELQIGKQTFVVRAIARPTSLPAAERHNAETLHGLQVAPDLMSAVTPAAPIVAPAVAAAHGDRGTSGKMDSRAPSEGEHTTRAEALELLGGVADKVLALGRGDEAERVLTTALQGVLSEAKRGREPAPRVVGRAATYAGKLAEATARGKWLDYTIELYAALRRPLPIELVDQMYGVLRRVDAVNLPSLRAYLSILHEQAQTYGPNERFAIQRLEGFERLASLK
jgi:hypothetical protein